MSEFSGVKCDGRNCTRVKGESNHWLKLSKDDEHLVLWRADTEMVTGGGIVLDFCSPACVITSVSSWLDRKLVEAEQVPEPRREVEGANG